MLGAALIPPASFFWHQTFYYLKTNRLNHILQKKSTEREYSIQKL